MPLDDERSWKSLVSVASKARRAKSSRISRSTPACLCTSASRVLSKRAASRRVKSFSVREATTPRRRQIPMWVSAVARCVFPTPTGPRIRTPWSASVNRRLVRSERAPVIGEVVGLVPGVQAHGRVQAGSACVQHR